MNDRPIDIEDPGEWAEWPPDDPRRRALEGRPSARARLRAYREFMSGGDPAEMAKLAEAEAKLAALIDAEVGIPGAAGGPAVEAPATQSRAAAAAGSAPRREAAQARRHPMRFPLFGSSRLKPLVAVAAVVLAAAGAGLVTTVLRQQQGDVLRGTETPATPGVWNARPETRVTGNAGLALRWAGAPGADHYAVVFVSDDLRELDRVEGITSLELILTREALPRGLAPGTAVAWRVLAYRGADEIGRSPASPVTLP